MIVTRTNVNEFQPQRLQQIKSLIQQDLVAWWNSFFILSFYQQRCKLIS